MPVESSKLWTLRLKRGKRTIVLFADPAHSLSHLKTMLLAVLHNAPSSGATITTPAPPPPASAAEIEIGKPVDLFDLSRGFTLLDPAPLDAMEDEGHKDKDKGKAKSKAATAAAGPSLRSLGVKENYVLAFRFRQQQQQQHDDGEQEVDETMGEEDAGWDVEIPTFEDIYGMENEGDLGAVPEYRG